MKSIILCTMLLFSLNSIANCKVQLHKELPVRALDSILFAQIQGGVLPQTQFAKNFKNESPDYGLKFITTTLNTGEIDIFGEELTKNKYHIELFKDGKVFFNTSSGENINNVTAESLTKLHELGCR